MRQHSILPQLNFYHGTQLFPRFASLALKQDILTASESIQRKLPQLPPPRLQARKFCCFGPDPNSHGLSWNPSLGGTNRTGLYVNWYYCVDAPMDQSNLPNATTQYLPGWTPIGIPAMNSTFDPFPLATGGVSTCQSYYEADQVRLSCPARSAAH